MKTLKSITISEVCEVSSLAPSLIRALVKWHGGWSEFKDLSKDLYDYGANTGASFIWNDDTTAFFKKHSKAIREWAAQETDCFGASSCVEMISQWGFNRGNVYSGDEIGFAFYAGKGDAVTSVYDVLVKATVEALARDVQELLQD